MLERILAVLETDGPNAAAKIFEEYRTRLSGENQQRIETAIARVRRLQAEARRATRSRSRAK